MSKIEPQKESFLISTGIPKTGSGNGRIFGR
jgi:hypothetical protein